MSPIPETARGYTYPASTGHTRTWEHWQDLATDIDADVAALETAMTARALYAYKLVGENVTSNTTLQDDDDLFITLPVGVWDVEALLSVSGLWDIKIAWTFSGTNSVTAARWCLGPQVATTDNNATSVHLATHGIATSVPYGTDNALGGGIMERFIYVVTGAGVLQMQWAQNATSVTPTSVNAGSRITAVRVG